MSDDTRRILEMLSQKKVTVDEADELLRAIGSPKGEPEASPAEGDRAEAGRQSPTWLRVVVCKTAKEGRPEKEVNVRVPIALVRGGLRLGAMLPGLAGDSVNEKLRERGIDLAKLTRSTADSEQFTAMLRDLGDMTIDVDDGKAQVRITCE